MNLFALDKNGNRVYIDKTISKEIYYCPTCGEQLIPRKGEINIHHFAHKADCICKDGWHYDMSAWHRSWQEKFPEECREVVKEFNGKKHRADILIEEDKIVIEFQHSHLEPEEFEDRNNFYNKLGYTVYWLFDLTEQYDNTLKNIKDSDIKYRWSRPFSTFNYIKNIKSNNVVIFFQIQEKNDFFQIDTIIMKINWISPQGFEYLATSPSMYYIEDEFIDLFLDCSDKYNKKEYLYDRLRFLYFDVNSGFFFYDGCPISKDSVCVYSCSQITEEERKKYVFCNNCKHSGKMDAISVCYKRLNDLNLSPEVSVKDIRKDTYGSLVSATIIEKSEERTIKFSKRKMSNIPDTIHNLWVKYNPNKAIFRNVNTNKYVTLYNDPNEQLLRYGTCKGYIGELDYDPDGRFTEIYYYDSPQWMLYKILNK